MEVVIVGELCMRSHSAFRDGFGKVASEAYSPTARVMGSQRGGCQTTARAATVNSEARVILI